MLAIRLGNGMLGDLRLNLWQAKCNSFDIENELKIRMGIVSVFVDVYDEMKQRLNKVPKSVIALITNDLKPHPGAIIEDYEQISTVLQCIAFIFP